jgi:hypothetical protein
MLDIVQGDCFVVYEMAQFAAPLSLKGCYKVLIIDCEGRVLKDKLEVLETRNV